jgi:hypothetical protein
MDESMEYKLSKDPRSLIGQTIAQVSFGHHCVILRFEDGACLLIERDIEFLVDKSWRLANPSVVVKLCLASVKELS